MGTEARITLHAPSTGVAESAAAAAFDRIAEIDRALSDYRVDSEVAAVAAAAGGAPVRVGEDLIRVLQAALDLAAETEGAFDPTAGPVSLVWREARRAGEAVEPAAAARAAALVDWRRVHVDASARTVRLETPGMRLDFGAIAKGYAADEALAVLRRFGTTSALVVFGGEIVAGDAPPGAAGWRMVIDDADEAHRELLIANEAVSTSGDSEQFVELGGVRHSHVLDARTGAPLSARVAATVVAVDGMTADGVATAVTVLDSARRAAFMARRPSVRFYVRRLVEGGSGR